MEAYERYGRILIRRAARLLGNPDDARDVVHGLFADLHERPGPTLDLPYLYRSVTNRCLTFLRDEKNRARLLERSGESLFPSGRTRCDERAIGLELLQKLASELDREETEVLTYHFLDDMTLDEIAALLGRSRKTIGKRLARVREVVRRVAEPGGSS